MSIAEKPTSLFPMLSLQMETVTTTDFASMANGSKISTSPFLPDGVNWFTNPPTLMLVGTADTKTIGAFPVFTPIVAR